MVTTMREFLPHAESELKFRALPDDEVAIIQLIERHEVGSSITINLITFEHKEFVNKEHISYSMFNLLLII